MAYRIIVIGEHEDPEKNIKNVHDFSDSVEFPSVIMMLNHFAAKIIIHDGMIIKSATIDTLNSDSPDVMDV